MPLYYSMEHAGGRVCYLATPYAKMSCKDRAAGYASTWQTILGEKGYTAISPIVQGHCMGVDWTQDEWMAWCKPMLHACGAVVVPPIQGRQESDGIALEMQWAHAANMPVIWLGP